MRDSALPTRLADWRFPDDWMRVCLFGCLYWLCFLLALEPGNLLNARHAGALPSLSHEAIRIGVASLLGGAATAIPALLTRTLPVTGAAWAKRALLHAAGAGALAFVLILVSCVLAAWVFESAWLPALDDVCAQLVGNWLLLTYALGALTAVLHLGGHLKAAPDDAAPADAAGTAAAPVMDGIVVKTRSGAHVVGLAEVDWVETHGNYLALHTRSGSHLIRETLTAFESRLDPARFVRIHRRVVVAVDRIAGIKPTGNGDALATLADGRELRVSRSYRANLSARIQASP